MSVILAVVLSSVLLTARGCHDLERVSCSENVSTLGALLSGDFAAGSVVCVNLELKSRETLDYTEDALTFSVAITGNNSTVTCREDSQVTDVDNLTIYTHFPLRFHDSSFVSITGLHFDGCKRPLQFQQVELIQISSSSFM